MTAAAPLARYGAMATARIASGSATTELHHAPGHDPDRRLNKAYREVLRYVDGDEKAKLLAAERAWMAFRDADCTFWGASGGTIAPMNEASCRARLSEDRAKELDGWPPNAPRDALAPLR